MKKAVEALRHEAQSVRTGRATPSLVEGLEVEAYGTPTPLISLAAISVPEPRLIVIQAWDKGLIKAIEKAIIGSDLGLTPSNDGSLIRLSLPSLTEEPPKAPATQLHKQREEGRLELRTLRRTVRAARDRGVEYVTLYSFSTENWKRDPDEVGGLMKLLEETIRRETPTLVQDGVRLRIIGRLQDLSDGVRRAIDEAALATDAGKNGTMTIPFNHG